MDEWTVVTVIAVLAGLMTSVIKPIINLNGSIIRLTETVNTLQKNIAGLTSKNDETHEKLWRKNEEQDIKLNQHETRLQIVERRL
ncbi:MAG TPA: hypothetical protein GXZ52_00595 [Clostridiales bacterium]|nr:hypothetical protein [Clostridiales bacterium]